MREFIKKGISVCVIIAIAVTFFAGMSFGGNTEVLAEQVDVFEVVVNDYFANKGESITIEANFYDESLQSIKELDDRYTFEWYKSTYINYQFVSNELVGDGINYKIDNLGEDDFYVNEKNYVSYSIVVYENGEYCTSAVFSVFDKEEYINIDFGYYYAYEGESITLKPEIKDWEYNNITDELGSEYTFKWYKGDDINGEEELDVTGSSYVIDEVKAEDFNDNGTWAYYKIEIYKNGVYRTSGYAFIEDAAKKLKIRGAGDLIVSKGETVILEAVVEDYKGNIVDISGEEYSFKWYKSENHEETELDVTGSKYIIDSVNESDLYTNDIYYYVELDVNDEWVSFASFYLYDKDDYYSADEQTCKAQVGDEITLVPDIIDGYGNKVDLNNTDLTFEWYRANDYDYDWIYEKVGEDSVYTIENVNIKDFYIEDDIYYVCRVSKNGERVCSAYFYIEEGIEETTEPPTTTVEPTTEQPTTEKPTTEQSTTTEPSTTKKEQTTKAKINKPGKAKITKITSKKKSAKKIKLSLKKISGANGYQIAVYTTNKNAKKNKKAIVKKFVKNVNATVTSKKLKNKKALFVKARAYKSNGNTKVYGKWSEVKKVKIKK